MKIDTTENEIKITIPNSTNSFVIEKIISLTRSLANTGIQNFTTPELKDRYFAIKHDWSIEEYYQLEDMPKTDEIMFRVVDKFQEFFTPTNGYQHRISKFDFCDVDGQSIGTSTGGWRIRDIVTTYKSTSQIEYHIILSDPNQKIRRFARKTARTNYKDINSHDIAIVVDGLKLLEKASQYENVDLVPSS